MIDFPRYLAAKKSVDDRALNRAVWEKLAATLADLETDRPLRILEAGCGIGTMVERLLEWGLADRADYLGIDSGVENIYVARQRLTSWGREQGYQVEAEPGGLVLRAGNRQWKTHFQEADVTRFWSRKENQGHFDVLVAHAFLDLIDLPTALPNLARLLSPPGFFYFTLNFDGQTLFEPVEDEALETQIMACYHASMDARQVHGRPSGDSRTGRHLFTHLRAAGAEILAAGASDWVVYPNPDGYPEDEAYFLNCILDFFESSLTGYPGLDQARFAAWLKERRSQVERAELIYIAHQLDFFGAFSV